MIGRIPPVVVWGSLSLAVISLGAAAGPVVWRSLGEDARLLPRQTSAAGEDPQPLDLAPILGFAPFGSPAAPEAPPTVAGETSLGLTLLGVTVADPETASRAIIKGGDVPVQSYGVGSDITAQARLAEVHKGYVVLSVDGRMETLSFVKGNVAGGAAAGGVDLRNLIARPAAAPDAAQSNDPDAVIARYRAAIQQNAQGVLDRLGLEPTDQGYRIRDTASAGVRQAGFRPGDVVTHVNGQKVGDVETDKGAFDAIAASGKARVELQRDGQVIVMTFPLQ